MKDSVKCNCCGALTAFGNLAKPGAEPIIFVGGSYKSGQMKISHEPVNKAKELCLWCGTKWPENLQKVMATAI